MVIRPYEEADEPQVIALWREAFPDAPPWNDPIADINRKLGAQRELFYVAADERGVAGTAMGGWDGHRGWVYYVAVRDDLRRRGIGAALMAHIERALWKLGCEKLNLQVRSSNAAVVSFYEKLGYAVEERVSMGKVMQLERSKS
jgi:ribosomal protein S18 acetylase RimI-like enzyme